MTKEILNVYDIECRTLVQDLGFAIIYYISEIDMLEVEYQAGCMVDRQEALQVIQASREFNDGRNRYTMITVVKDYFNMTSEARATFADEMKTGFDLERMAILVNSLVYRMLANFFIKIDKPPVPTRMFNSRKDAIDWLINN